MSDKSYAAVTGNVVTDWPRVIERLDTMDSCDHGHYSKMARDWPTCACGNQCAIIPRHEAGNSLHAEGCPKDEKLSDLGSDFAYYILTRGQPEALACWQAIEVRATELVAQELAKLNAP